MSNIHPTYVNIANITVTDPFFAPFLDRIRTVSAPDILKKFLAEGAIGNYERVARGETGGHVGPPWYHGLICECIRGISDLLVAHYDKSLDDSLDAIIEKIAAAQAVDPEGYINPYTTLMCPEQRWGLNGGNIRWQHETYDAGALVEAGVHHFRATGKTSLLKVAVKMANYLASVIGPAPKWNVTAEHSL
ncbi:MAG: glycoside hydrolase family 127 protein, partial [Clostridia bacterium]|nr:glycoside hydrolase family 127 protein [Clostridia bacterium]